MIMGVRFAAPHGAAQEAVAEERDAAASQATGGAFLAALCVLARFHQAAADTATLTH